MANIMNMDLGGGSYVIPNNSTVGSNGQRIRKPATQNITPAGNPNVNTSVVPGSSSTGGSGGGVGGSGVGVNALATPSNAYADYLAALKAERDAAVAQANEAVDAQVSAQEQRLRNQIKDIQRDYTDLRRQSEVNRFKARIKQREMLANQGRLDSGAGRMEYTTLGNNFDNNLNKINLQEQSEKRSIMDAINELIAQGMQMKAQNNLATIGNYGTSLMNMLSNIPAGYNPGTSDYYTAASDIANTTSDVSPTVRDGRVEAPSSAALAKAYEDQNNQKTLRDRINDLFNGQIGFVR